MFKQLAIGLMAAILLSPVSIRAPGVEGTLLDLARVKDGARSKRISSFYRSGGYKAFPPLPAREARAPKPVVRPHDIHRWRHEWRKDMGNDPTLW